MYPNRQLNNSFRQRGSMLVIAIFVIVVMSLLGLTITQILSASSDAVIHEVYGVRALNAAQTGIQASIADAFPVSGASVCAGTGTPLVLDLSAVNGLENCTVTATCVMTPFDAGTVEYYRFNSVGTCSAGDVIASRHVAVDAKVE